LPENPELIITELTKATHIYFTVTNDLVFDQRMRRICNSLSGAGYFVTLVGRQYGDSPVTEMEKYRQVRLHCYFRKGRAFYAEFNIRLFLYLFFSKIDIICAIDLDTILPCLLVSRAKGITRIYDAHELFCEMKEIVSRPGIYRYWKTVEKWAVPHFHQGYTISDPIAQEFEKNYGVHYSVIRNLPCKQVELDTGTNEGFILYQGAVNEGRSFETLIPAMIEAEANLLICGDGNFTDQARALVKKYKLEDKIIFKGMLRPVDLRIYTQKAKIGLTLFENTGKSNYYSLANRFFDYIQAGLPQICVDYPAYRTINEQFNVALLIPDLEPHTIACALNNLLQDDVLYEELHENCLKARDYLNWEEEEKKLLFFYNQLSS
jgi:glycosyltransferase involved in cell wall biosynthesis